MSALAVCGLGLSLLALAFALIRGISRQRELAAELDALRLLARSLDARLPLLDAWKDAVLDRLAALEKTAPAKSAKTAPAKSAGRPGRPPKKGK